MMIQKTVCGICKRGDYLVSVHGELVCTICEAYKAKNLKYTGLKDLENEGFV